ncbi:MAG: lipid A 4'-phosphatase [Cyclobacteriaceae bacterium]|nr:MAG: lipid A 4'-phosphatase [Cyclobacteriaceae bacterium]
MPEILELIDQLDKELLLSIQRQSSPFLDFLMAAITDKYNWIPLYLVLLIGLFRQFGWQAVYFVLAVVVLITLSDQLTSSLMKPYFGRFRPCHDPEIGHLVRIVTRCGGSYGFVSSHAANSVAVSTFFILIFRKSHPFVWLVIIWPLVVCYSRMYLGVHYPLDILGGTAVGVGLGYLVYWGTQKLSMIVPFKFKPASGNRFD